MHAPIAMFESGDASSETVLALVLPYAQAQKRHVVPCSARACVGNEVSRCDVNRNLRRNGIVPEFSFTVDWMVRDAMLLRGRIMEDDVKGRITAKSLRIINSAS